MFEWFVKNGPCRGLAIKWPRIARVMGSWLSWLAFAVWGLALASPEATADVAKVRVHGVSDLFAWVKVGLQVEFGWALA